MEEIVYAQFIQDPRVSQAKKLLIEAVKEHAAKINEIRPPIASLAMRYDELIDSVQNLRGGELYFPYLSSGMGNGPFVQLLDGSVKYDLISGIGPHYFGHSHPQIISAGIDAALNDTAMQGHLQQGIEPFKFSSLLTQSSGLDHCFLSSSGAMANENALKIIFQKKFPASRILAFERCFMGKTLALSQITDKPAYRQGLPALLDVDYVPFYRENEPEKSLQEALTVLKNHLHRYPKQHAVMCFEIVQGESGFYAGSREFFIPLITLLKEHEITIFVDEVQTFGRTSQLFAFQYLGLQDYVDIVTIGKMSQVCGTLFKSELKPQPSLLSQTFIASTASLQVGYVLVKRLLEGEFFGEHGKIQQMHSLFVEMLNDIASRYPGSIEGPYGVGAMIAFTPVGGKHAQVSRFIRLLFDEGIISFIAGTHPARVRLLPPIEGLHMRDVSQIGEIIEKALNKSIVKKGAAS